MFNFSKRNRDGPSFFNRGKEKEGPSLFLIFFIALIDLFVYFPSFFHVARSDQLIYLANTQGIEGWIALAIKTYSYDRVPHIFEGLDAVLFRPFFFFILGTEKFFFGFKFILWQITGFILHLFVVWNILRLLWRIRPGLMAGLVALYFSVLFVGMEMVIWHHINGYLIFLSCVLISLNHLYQITMERKVYGRQLWGIFFCLLIAVFTYELGLVYSVLFFVYLWVVVGRKNKGTESLVLEDGPDLGFSSRAQTQNFLGHSARPEKPKSNPSSTSRFWYLIILIPAMIYVACNLIDLHFRHRGFSQGQTVLNAFHLWPTLQRAFCSMYWCFYAGLFPGHLTTRCLQRTLFNAGDFLQWQSIFSVAGILKLQAVNVIGMILAFVMTLGRQWSWKGFRARGMFAGLVALMLMAQMVLIVMARINFKQLVDVLMHNAYYAYYFWMYAVIILYIFWSCAEARTETAGNRTRSNKGLVCQFARAVTHRFGTGLTLLNIFLMISLIIAISTNGYYVRKLNQKRAKADTVRRFLVENIEGHIQEEKKGAENFSFFVDPKVALELPWVKKVGDKSDKKYTFLELIYPNHFDRRNPRYIYKLGDDGIKIGKRY